MNQNPRINDPEWLKTQYWERGLSFREIAKIAGCSRGVVRRRMHKYQIPLRPAGGNNLRAVVRRARA